MTALASFTLITGIAVAFFDVVVWDAFGYPLGVAVLAVVSFFLLGVAVVSLVPKAASALPVAYGTMLPLAFISAGWSAAAIALIAVGFRWPAARLAGVDRKDRHDGYRPVD